MKPKWQLIIFGLLHALIFLGLFNSALLSPCPPCVNEVVPEGSHRYPAEVRQEVIYPEDFGEQPEHPHIDCQTSQTD